jgi:ribosomal protein L44E
MNGALSVCEKRVQLINSCWLLRSYNKRVVWEAQRDARATIRRFNARLSAKGYSWFWPKIAAALTSKHHWLVINCDSCGTVVDSDLRVKPRDPEASIRVALRDVQCPRCNGHGRPRIIALAQHPS